MNADVAKIQAAFTTIDTQLTAEAAAITIMQGKVANLADPLVLATLATQVGTFVTRQKTNLDALTALDASFGTATTT